jgi:drug/metabolite transporter (DMT)-like permease
MISVTSLVAALVLFSGGQIAFKLYFERKQLLLLLGACGTFVVAQIGFFLALRELSVGIVSMSMGLAQVLVLAMSHYVLRETVTRHHLIAVGLIVSGLGLYAL